MVEIMNRRTFLRNAAATAALVSSRPCWSAAADPNTPTDSDLLSEAGRRIEQHRKGDGVISVRAAGGKPIQGATIRIEQLRHEFRFGCNFFMFGRIQEVALEEEYRRRFAALLNYATL